MADTFTPTSIKDNGTTLVFYDVGGNSRQVPRDSDKAGLYLRRLNIPLTADLEAIARGSIPSAPEEATIKTVNVSISENDLASMHSVPKLLIPAPGNGKKIQIISISLYLRFVTTIYTDASNSQFVFGYKDANGPEIARAPVNPVLTSNEHGLLEIDMPATIDSQADANTWVNQPVVLSLTNAITAGDSGMTAKINYVEEETGL